MFSENEDFNAVAIATLLESISTKIDFYKNEFLDGLGKLIHQCVMTALTTGFFLTDHEDYTYNELVPYAVIHLPE